MKKGLSLLVFSSLFFSSALLLLNANVGVPASLIHEEAVDFIDGRNGVARNVQLDEDETVDVSRTFVQYALTTYEGKDVYVMRFATAIKGNISSVSYERAAIDGVIDSKSFAVNTLYKGISSGGSSVYYNPEAVDADENGLTTNVENAGDYYWACYSIRYVTGDTYHASDISASIVINGELKGTRTANLQELVDADHVHSASTLTISGEFKTEYAMGETFDATGMTVTSICSECGDEFEITDFEVSKTTPLGLGDDKVTISYDGQLADVGITVSNVINITDANIIEGGFKYRSEVPWSNSPYNDDFVQNCYDGTVMEFDVYSDAERSANIDLTAAAAHVIEREDDLPKIIGDMHPSRLFKMYVNEEEVYIPDSLAVSGSENETPTNNNLALWDTINLANVLFKEGQNKVRLNFNASPYINADESKSSASLNIDYFTINVDGVGRKLTEISVANQPNKTEYFVGQTFDPTGLKIMAKFDDGEFGYVNNYTYSEVPLTIEDDKVLINYGGLTCEVPITVTEIDELINIEVSGIDSPEFVEGNVITGISLDNIVVKGIYLSGNIEELDPSMYSVEIPEGNAVIGSSIKISYLDDSSIYDLVPLKVSKDVNLTEGHFTGTIKYRSKVAWSNSPKGDDFIQNCNASTIATLKITSQIEVKANLSLTAASGLVLAKLNNLPSEIGDMQINKLFNLVVNGEHIDIDDSSIITGGKYSSGTNNNLARWVTALVAEISLKEGENTIELLFKTSVYKNADGSTATPNIDYLTVSTKN